MNRVTNLAASTPPAAPNPFAGLIRGPGQYLCPDGLIFEPLEQAVRRHLFKQRLPWLRAERFQVIQGGAGVGKTTGAVDASLRFGVSVALLPVAMLASEHEGGAVKVLDDFLAYVTGLSRQSGQNFVVVADDADLGITGADAKTGKTINTNLLTQRWQMLADTGEYRNADGSGLAFIFTGNDFTSQRASLFRPGRASWFTLAPTLEDKTQIVLQLFKPRSSTERHALEKLVRSQVDQPVAFWHALHTDLMAARLDEMIARGITDGKKAEADYRKPLALDAAHLNAIAKARASATAANFL